MALIKYSALVSGMSGKLNGSVAARNKGGNYLRNKTTPVNGQTTFQQNARARFGGMSSNFRQLVADNVTAWNAAAANFPYTNIFGDVSYLNGLQLFTKLNTNLGIIGQVALSSPPKAEGSGSVVLASVAINKTTSTLTPVLTSVAPVGGARLVYEATAALSGGVRFYKNQFRQFAVQTAGTVPTPAALYTAYVARFGVPPNGANIAVRVSQVNMATGERTVGSVVRAAITP